MRCRDIWPCFEEHFPRLAFLEQCVHLLSSPYLSRLSHYSYLWDVAFDIYLLTLHSDFALQHGRISPPSCPEDNGARSGLFSASLSPLCRNIRCRPEARPAGAAKEGPLCCVAHVCRLLSPALRPRGDPFSARSSQTELAEAQTTGTVPRAPGLPVLVVGGIPAVVLL